MLDLVHPPGLHKVHHTDALASGTRLGEFELVRLLGVGGFGMVYQAYDHSLQRSVAIKEYLPTALAGRTGGASVVIRSSLDGSSYQAGLQSFVAEARLLAQFDHPSLVKVLRFWEANNTAYMVMPLYHGMTLKQARSQMRRPPSEAWLRQVLWSVLEALKLLHAQQTLHRDVSPDNIFLQDVGPPVLLDLGAARRAIGDLSRKHTAVLKVNYAPIEQYADARDMVQGAWSDLYSLAAVVHGYLANDLPLPATFRVLRDRMPSMRELAQSAHSLYGCSYSPAFVDTLDRSLAIRPEDRPQSVEAFSESLDLQVPPDMARFDWRAAMGEGWKLSRDEQAARAKPQPADLAEQPTQFVYRPAAPVVLDVAAAAPVPLAVAGPQTLWRKSMRWGVAAMLAVGAAAAGMYWSGYLPATKAPAVAAMPAVALGAKPAGVAEPVAAIAEQAASKDQAAPQVPAASSSQPAASAAKATRPVVRKPRVAAPPASSASVTAAAPQSRPREARVSTTVVELCPESNFISRPMCLYRECQKPEFAELQVCVENTQRLNRNQRKHS
ncbi:MAG: serine/threonine-protein kinase [Burkholderiales bacterium]|nr:serine/threonine-protein kinase [Burkholderiales bacterium]